MANSNGWGDGAANNAIGWGQGANNNIGWGDSHAKSWAGSTDIVGLTTDADAQAFITAAAITDATQQSAIDTLVKGMKADGIWTKMKAIYPFVGGTATTHKWNLKDPRDLDAAFRLVFNGGWTHSSTGATPNGTNGYADTKFNPSLSGLSSTSTHISTYLRTNNDGVFCDIGAYDGNTSNYQISTYARITNICYVDLGAQLQTRQTYANTDSRGYYVASRTANNILKAFKNNILKSTNTNTNTSPITVLNKNIFISANNDTGGSITQFSTRQQAFTSIGDGLSDTEAANLYTRVQAFQTALSRQV